jgi:hypothetical protein
MTREEIGMGYEELVQAWRDKAAERREGGAGSDKAFAAGLESAAFDLEALLGR